MDYNYKKVEKLAQKVDDISDLKHLFSIVGTISMIVTFILLVLITSIKDDAPACVSQICLISALITLIIMAISLAIINKCEIRIKQYNNKIKNLVNDSIYRFKNKENK